MVRQTALLEAFTLHSNTATLAFFIASYEERSAYGIGCTESPWAHSRIPAGADEVA